MSQLLCGISSDERAVLSFVATVLVFLTDVKTFYIKMLISHATENTKFYTLKPTS